MAACKKVLFRLLLVQMIVFCSGFSPIQPLSETSYRALFRPTWYSNEKRINWNNGLLSGFFGTYVIGQKVVNLFQNFPLKGTGKWFETCRDAGSGEYGTCMGKFACSSQGGTKGSRCGFNTVCCFGFTVSRCEGQITMNNTYWTIPSLLNGFNSCGASIRLDTNRQRQGEDICQIRLDFLSFEISQPGGGARCFTDQFQVSGTSNAIPAICGVNSGQHMYLHVLPSSREIRLNFYFAYTYSQRNWKIRVSLLPCGANYLAPSNCLQYYTESFGSVTSFYSQNVLLSRNSLGDGNGSAVYPRGPDVARAFTARVASPPTATPTPPTNIPSAPVSTGRPTTVTTTTPPITTTTVTTTTSAETTTTPVTTVTTTTEATTTTITTEPTTSQTTSTTTTETTTIPTTTETTTTLATTTSAATTATETTTNSVTSTTESTTPTTSEATTTQSTPETTTSLATTVASTTTETTSRATTTTQATTTTPGVSSTSRPVLADGYKYQVLKFGDAEVKICTRRISR